MILKLEQLDVLVPVFSRMDLLPQVDEVLRFPYSSGLEAFVQSKQLVSFVPHVSHFHLLAPPFSRLFTLTDTILVDGTTEQ